MVEYSYTLGAARVLFYCEPMQDKTDWEIFKDRRSLLGALSRNFQNESYNDVFFIT